MAKNKQPAKQGVPSQPAKTTPKENEKVNQLPKFNVAVTKTGIPAIRTTSSSREIAQLMGLKDGRAGSHLVAQIADALEPFRDSPPSRTTDVLNEATALLAELKPHDAYEAILISQMIAAHNQSMECLRRANLSEQSDYGRELNLRFGERFLRIYATQMEALSKHRRGGKQKVIVEHVHVHEGGQAIVGNIESKREGGDEKKN